MTEADVQDDPFLADVARCVDRHALIPRGAAVLVGVSGGGDSVGLLGALRELAGRPDRSWRLAVCHLNHRLRPDADADERFVAELARTWGLPCMAERRDVAADARTSGDGVERAARRARYDLFRRVARETGATRVALAHHADDNVETVLHHVLRGTHLRGLAGIPIRRELEGSPASIVRPLLEIRRERIEAFCRRNALAWRTDPTNADTSLRRNFIRHELLPLLRERLNPRADGALLRLAAAAGSVEAYLSARGAEALAAARLPDRDDPPATVLDREALAAADPVIQTYALRAALERAGAPMRQVGADRLAEVRGLLDSSGPAAVSLPAGWAARRDGEVVILQAPAARAAPADWSAPLACPGRTPLPGGGEISCRIEAFDDGLFEAHCRDRPPGVELLDADALRGPLSARARRPGDAFHPLGAPGRQTVSDFLTNGKVPPRARRDVVCVCDGGGIAYVAPLRIDERLKVTDATRRVLRVTLRAGGR